MTKDPTDEELLEFVELFVGGGEFLFRPVPDYLNSVDAWLRDVWPKVQKVKYLPALWQSCLVGILQTDHGLPQINADARSRCLALWRALEGKLP